uniref:Transmembrane protein n=1 Tax=Opuntia streptacantha TaxID=393608 RepID=A0A7C9CTT4_OPUST
MFSTLRLQASNSAIDRKCTSNFARNRTLPSPAAALRIPSSRRFTVISFQLQQNGVSSSEPSISSGFTSSVGSPPLQLSQYTLTQRHVNVLYVAACAVAISATFLFCSAIPTLLSFKRAAESLEKLMDATREELPGTMAAVRLSGMEISDLTMELSDLGQGITQGVRSSTRAVRMAGERLRHFANMNSAGRSQNPDHNS